MAQNSIILGPICKKLEHAWAFVEHGEAWGIKLINLFNCLGHSATKGNLSGQDAIFFESFPCKLMQINVRWSATRKHFCNQEYQRNLHFHKQISTLTPNLIKTIQPKTSKNLIQATCNTISTSKQNKNIEGKLLKMLEDDLAKFWFIHLSNCLVMVQIFKTQICKLSTKFPLLPFKQD